MASTIGSLPIVEMLLEAKADVWVRDSLKCVTALECAESAAHLDLFRPLIRAGALSPLPGQGSWVHYVPLQSALERGSPDRADL
jgi:hypothetical protein